MYSGVTGSHLYHVLLIYTMCRNFNSVVIGFGAVQMQIRIRHAFVQNVFVILFICLQVDLFTGALFIQQSLGWDLYLSIFILVAIVTILTITGQYILSNIYT